MEQVWNLIENNNDIEYVLARFGYFYDACIKEAKYLSGSYVEKDSSMHPKDDLVQLHIIIQTQHKEHSVIEFVFEGVERFNLATNEDYDSIISGIQLKQIDGHIYFSNSADVPTDELDKNSKWLTWIKAKSLKWREINKYIGSTLVYIHRE